MRPWFANVTCSSKSECSTMAAQPASSRRFTVSSREPSGAAPAMNGRSSRKPKYEVVRSIKPSLERFTEEGEHAAPVHDADPEEQRRGSHELRRQRNVFLGADARHSPMEAREIERPDVEAGEEDEGHLQPE